MTIQLAVTQGVEKSLEPLSEQVDEIHRRMFVDNGKLSMQSAITSLHNQTRFQWWILGGVATAIGLMALSILADEMRPHPAERTSYHTERSLE